MVSKRVPLTSIEPHRELELDLLRWLVLLGEEKKEVADMIFKHLTVNQLWVASSQKLFTAYRQAYSEGRPRDLLSLLIEIGNEEGQRNF